MAGEIKAFLQVQPRTHHKLHHKALARRALEKQKRLDQAMDLTGQLSNLSAEVGLLVAA